jgi:hypothetical protein
VLYTHNNFLRLLTRTAAERCSCRKRYDDEKSKSPLSMAHPKVVNLRRFDPTSLPRHSLLQAYFLFSQGVSTLWKVNTKNSENESGEMLIDNGKDRMIPMRSLKILFSFFIKELCYMGQKMKKNSASAACQLYQNPQKRRNYRLTKA